MSSTHPLVAARPIALKPWRPARWHPHLHGSELAWAIAFVVPYAVMFLAFALYPIAYGLWMGSDPALYVELLGDAHYAEAALNTALFAGFATNIMMFAALLLSGFFMRRRWWIKALLAFCMLPWALPALPAYVSFHWMLIGDYGFLDSLLNAVFGIDGPEWFADRWLALGCDIVAYIWKWLPFWILIFYAGRMAIPQDLYEAAEIDGASGYRRFVHITAPLLTNLYLICTALCAIWVIGDFTAAELVSSGSPSLETEVLSSLSIHYAFDISKPALGVAAALSALPVLIPLVIILIRRVEAREVQL
jgi:multiple sugar transport system permease protein